MLPLILIAIANTAGFILKYFDLPRHLSLLGFRFHLSLVVPFFLVFLNKDSLHILKEYYLFPKDRKYLLSILFILVPASALLTALFASGLADLGDPDYFYELGITSIVDYPVYLIWNTPQLFMLASFLIVVTHKKKYNQLLILLSLLSLFVYELVPLKKQSFNIPDAGALMMASAAFALFFSKIRNVYMFSLVVFSTLWINVLLFGSSSETLVRILLANNYDQWGGMIEVGKLYSPYIMMGQLAASFILFFIPFMLISKQINRRSVAEYQMESLNK